MWDTGLKMLPLFPSSVSAWTRITVDTEKCPRDYLCDTKFCASAAELQCRLYRCYIIPKKWRKQYIEENLFASQSQNKNTGSLLFYMGKIWQSFTEVKGLSSVCHYEYRSLKRLKVCHLLLLFFNENLRFIIEVRNKKSKSFFSYNLKIQ